jgi:hypothetical protein
LEEETVETGDLPRRFRSIGRSEYIVNELSR